MRQSIVVEAVIAKMLLTDCEQEGAPPVRLLRRVQLRVEQAQGKIHVVIIAVALSVSRIPELTKDQHLEQFLDFRRLHNSKTQDMRRLVVLAEDTRD